MTRRARTERRQRGRGALAIVLAVVSTMTGWAFLWTGDCHTDTQCVVQNVVLFALLLGGWGIVLVAAVTTAVLRWRGSARTRLPLTVALVLLGVLPFTPALYATFKDGPGAVTQGGREKEHAEATRRIVSVVDSAVAVLPGVTPTVETPAGTLEENGTSTCERVRYLVNFPVAASKQPEVAAAVAERWRLAGMEVRSADVAGGPHVSAEDGGTRFYLQRRFADRANGTLEMGGNGPCLAL